MQLGDRNALIRLLISTKLKLLYVCGSKKQFRNHARFRKITNEIILIACELVIKRLNSYIKLRFYHQKFLPYASVL